MSEEFGILEDTQYGRTVTICVDEHEQNTIWNMHTEYGKWRYRTIRTDFQWSRCFIRSYFFL